MVRQKLLEREVIGIAMIKFELVSKAKKEDFEYYSSLWQMIEEAKGYSVELLLKCPKAYRFSDNSPYTQFSIERMLYELFESTFKRLLDKTYTYYLNNSKSPLEALKISEIKEEVNGKDILDLIDNLPEYFQINGLESNKINNWSAYCQKRIENGI